MATPDSLLTPLAATVSRPERVFPTLTPVQITRIESGREHPQRGQVTVVVVIVTEQHGRNARQIVEAHAGLADPPRPEPRQRGSRARSTSGRSGRSLRRSG